MTAGLIDALLGLYNVDHSVIIHNNQVFRENEAYHRLVFNKTSCEIFIHI